MGTVLYLCPLLPVKCGRRGWPRAVKITEVELWDVLIGEKGQSDTPLKYAKIQTSAGCFPSQMGDAVPRNSRFLGPTLRAASSIGVGWGPWICISDKRRAMLTGQICRLCLQWFWEKTGTRDFSWTQGNLTQASKRILSLSYFFFSFSFLETLDSHLAAMEWMGFFLP